MKPRQGSGVRVALSSQWVGTFLISQLGCPTATFTWTGEKTPPWTLNGHKGREQTGRWNQVCDLGLKSPGAKGIAVSLALTSRAVVSFYRRACEGSSKLSGAAHFHAATATRGVGGGPGSGVPAAEEPPKSNAERICGKVTGM